MNIFNGFEGFGKNFNLLWHKFCAIFIVVNGQKLKMVVEKDFMTVSGNVGN